MLTLEPCGSPDQAARRPCLRPCGGWPTAWAATWGACPRAARSSMGSCAARRRPPPARPSGLCSQVGAASVQLRAEQACLLLMGA